MNTRPFVHLHCHSHFSLLDGAAPIGRLIERARHHGMNALAITDHGNLHGALEFYRKAMAAHMKPIIGYEAYVAPGDRRARETAVVKDASYHLTLLAQNRTGFNNLVQLASRAFLEGFYRKPRIDKEILTEHAEGLICLSGCVSGELSRLLLQHRGTEFPLAEATRLAEWFARLFGERYFIEIQNNGVELQRIVMEGSLEIARRLGIPPVATCDSHYVDREDAEAQDVLLCINTGRFRSDTNRMRMEGNEYYLRSPGEMYAAFPGHEDAVARSQAIADTIDIQLELGRRHFPTYPLPVEASADETLRSLCWQGLRERYRGNARLCPDGELAPAVVERLNRELDVIARLGFSNYFLIVWDVVRRARELGIPATARGSGVGALVSYALYLSHVCPIQYDLLFERFLDPSRKEAPDIDIDFCKERRGEIIRYVKEKYGEENVAQIGTFGTLAARAAIRDVGRALGIPLSRVNQVVQMVPEQLGITLAQALRINDDFRLAYDTDSDIRELIDLARKIEGLARNVGTHAAAVVIADRPLTDYVPLGRVTGKTDIITQWSMNDVEAAGLLKMDFLGLRNLTILAKAVQLIAQTTGTHVDPYQFDMADQQTFDLLSRGETKGIFQLESSGIRDLLQRMKPDSFQDLIATNALYRPGPLEGGMVDDYVAVKHGRKKAEYKHPVLKEILEETHGVMVYQEQVMRILNRLGGIELANAYTCIKAISKKKQETIDAFHEQFVAGATQQGLAAREANELWELIQKFAGYGFNKSHSTAYALIAYMTAYLKAHYPLEFMAALLSGDIPGRNFQRKDALVEHLEDCQRMGVEVVPPDVNHSETDFSVADGKIFFGLAAIKGCGVAADAIVASRRQDGRFRDLFELCERLEPANCSRAAVEALIKAGAMDSLGGHRAQQMAALERALQAGAAAAADRRAGQLSLFDHRSDPSHLTAADLPDSPPWDERERLLMEKEVLGFYLTSHPLAEHETALAHYCTHRTSELARLRDRTEVLLGGILSSIRTAQVRKLREQSASTKYAMFDLEDTEGTVRCILWPEAYAVYGYLVRADAILVARGLVDHRGGDEINLIVNELIPLDELKQRCTRSIVVRLDEAHHGPDRLKALHQIARSYPGDCQLQLELRLTSGQCVSLTAHDVRVDVQPEFRRRVDDLLSPGHLRFITSPSRTSMKTPLGKGDTPRLAVERKG
jgi:DNA polymerase-3 subunit alpha